MAFIKVTNYDEFKGYIGEEFLERYKIGKEVFLVRLPEVPKSAEFYKIVNGDGKSDCVQAIEIKNELKLTSLRGKLEKLLPHIPKDLNFLLN